MNPSYTISGILPAGTVDELSPGTSVLVTGPAMVGKEALAVRLLAAGHEEGDGILCVTTSKDAGKILGGLEQAVPALDRSRVGIVDCSGVDNQRTIRDITMERVSSPGDLTGISIGTAKLVQQFATQDISEVRHGLVSVSTLLQYLDLETVFKFLHIYTSRIADTDGLGVFTLDTGAHDQQTINTITGEFDCVVALRETADGDRELRVVGHPGAERTWHPY